MFLLNLLLWLLLGTAAGWIAGKLMGFEGGLVQNAVLGAAGSVAGGFVAHLLGLRASRLSLGSLLIAVGGACLVILLVRKLKR